MDAQESSWASFSLLDDAIRHVEVNDGGVPVAREWERVASAAFIQ